MKKKYAARLLSALLAVALLLTLGACASASKDFALTDTAPGVRENYSYNDNGYMQEVSFDAVEEMGEYATSDMAPMDPGAGGSGNLSMPTDGRKVILRADVTLEAKEYDAALQALLDRTEELGGYLASREDYDYGAREVSLCLRVPSEKFDVFLTGMSEIANVTRMSQSAEDITESYLETQSYLESLEVQQDRLLELLSAAETLEDLLAIEDRLAEVRAQLQYYDSLKKSYDSRVDDATIYVTLNEVRDYTVTEPTFGERLLAALQNSGRGFVDFLQGLLFTLIALAPYLIILAPLTIVVVRALRRRRTTHPPKKGKKPARAAEGTQTAEAEVEKVAEHTEA